MRRAGLRKALGYYYAHHLLSSITIVSSKIQANNEVFFQTIFDEAVILSIANNHYYGLNDLATRVWQLLVEHGDPERVIAAVLEEYEVDEVTLRRDLEVFLSNLEQRGLVNRQAR